MRPEERDAAYLWDMLDALRATHPEIPWQQIIGQRNVLAHEYGEIRHERIWLVVRHHIPELIRSLEPLLPPEGHDPSIG